MIGHDKPSQVPALPPMTLVGPGPAGSPSPLEPRSQLPHAFSALNPIFPNPRHWPCVSDHLLYDCPPWQCPSSVSQDKRRNRWMGPAERPRQLSQLPSLVCTPPSDVCSVSFNGGWGWRENRRREDPTVTVTRLNVLPTGSLPLSCRD